MTNPIPEDAIIAPGANISPTAQISRRVIVASDDVNIKQNARLDAACVIADGVTVGQGAWIRPGAVVLRSVPPNAIVEGNPARVVGYLAGSDSLKRPVPKLVDYQTYRNLDRPAKVPLGVGNSTLYLMRQIVDARGALTVGEVPTEVPFPPARYFAVYDVPSAELRGEHAHLRCEQFLICMHGSCRVLLDDGAERCEVVLDRPDMGVHMPPMIWGTQYQYSHDAVLLVFASRPYEAEDYLRTYEDFIAAIGSEPK